MNILLVNDDGISEERMLYAERVLREYGDVLVVVPAKQQSGMSMAISIKEVQYNSLSKRLHVVVGTPADCISVALFSSAFKYKPDLIVSGVNRGSNLGIDTLYSGTVGAALQGLYYGCKAVAFSSDYEGTKNVKKYFKSTLDYILDNNLLSNDYILNVNFPEDTFTHDADIRMTKRHMFKTKLWTRTHNKNVEFKREIIEDDYPEDSDIHVFRTGHISITKLGL